MAARRENNTLQGTTTQRRAVAATGFATSTTLMSLQSCSTPARSAWRSFTLKLDDLILRSLFYWRLLHLNGWTR
ncbi:hypothetical protein ZWY2020_048298 [Hordeum vulgare]|nr:hypothetical protein ZWY2020_048298 [Hordeum vulgare]